MPRIQGAAAGEPRRHSPTAEDDENTGRTTRRSHMQSTINVKGNSGEIPNDKGVSITGAAAADRDALRCFSDEENTNPTRRERTHDHVATSVSAGTESLEPSPKKMKSQNESAVVSESSTPDKAYSNNITMESAPKEEEKPKNDEELMMEALMNLKKRSVRAEDLPPLSSSLTNPKSAKSTPTARTKPKRKYTKRSKTAKSATVTPRKNSKSDSRSSSVSTEGIQPTELDVLLGRGKRSNFHEGNRRFRKLVEEHKPLYFRKENKRNGKNLISIQVMEKVHAWGGRFLRPVPGKHPIVYEEVEDKVARKKCSQRLREGEVQGSYNYKTKNEEEEVEEEEEEEVDVEHDDDDDDDEEDSKTRTKGIKGLRSNIGKVASL